MVETVGIEPTVFLMSLIYSQLPSPLGTHLHIGTHYQSRGFEPLSLIVYHDFCSQASNVFLYGAPEETRTPKIWLLRPTRIPIPSPGQFVTTDC
jgi:hypothetical protein